VLDTTKDNNSGDNTEGDVLDEIKDALQLRWESDTWFRLYAVVSVSVIFTILMLSHLPAIMFGIVLGLILWLFVK
jgi:hypothetical protein